MIESTIIAKKCTLTTSGIQLQETNGITKNVPNRNLHNALQIQNPWHVCTYTTSLILMDVHYCISYFLIHNSNFQFHKAS